MENNHKSLAEALLEEMARVREILGYYKEIGQPGAFGAFMIELSLKNADNAVMNGDVYSMARAYNDLKDIQS